MTKFTYIPTHANSIDESKWYYIRSLVLDRLKDECSFVLHPESQRGLIYPNNGGAVAILVIIPRTLIKKLANWERIIKPFTFQLEIPKHLVRRLGRKREFFKFESLFAVSLEQLTDQLTLDARKCLIYDADSSMFKVILS